MRNRVLVLMAAMLSVASGYVTCCHVEPIKAAWSGWTGRWEPNNNVSQTVTCNFDSLSYVELFAGAKGSGGPYWLSVRLGGLEVVSSDGDSVPDHGWVRFQNWNRRIAFTKGKEYKFRFTRTGPDSGV